MSYILDALKKLETEKERKARGGGMVNIAGELFKDGPAPHKERHNWPVVLGLVLLASLVTFGATFLLLRDGKGERHRVSAPPALPVPSRAAPTVPTPTIPPAPVPKPPVSGQLPGPPAVAAPRHAVATPAPVAKARQAPSATRHPPVAKPAPPSVPAAGGGHAEPSRPVAVSLVPAPADIKVSGIAWQEHRAASRVVVNGFLLREGDAVSGARIVEIFQNRVRFNSAAGTFEVYLVATGVPGPPK